MSAFSQGDIIKISSYRQRLFVIVSKNAFIHATGMFHVSPLLSDASPGPVHIPVCGIKNVSGTAICEEINLIDPAVRNCTRVDRLAYADIMNVSDAVQGIFEYD